MVYSLIAAEAMGILIGLVLLYASRFEIKASPRRKQFTLLVAANLFANGSDMLSWILDGSASAQPFLFAITVCTLIATFLVYVPFCQYVMALASEKHPFSPRHYLPVKIFVLLACLWTIIESFTGALFTLEQGVYVSGDLYHAYLIVNVLFMLYVVIDIIHCAKYFDPHDFWVLFSYLFLPFCAMILNFYIPDYSFTYPAMSIALLIIYIMLQSNTERTLIAQEKAISVIAKQDSLTGLQNHRAFAELFSPANDEMPMGIIFCDVNGLKYTNDHLGHSAGDQLLRDFAQLLLSCYRKDDLYRISGDEFVVAIPNLSEQDFLIRARRLQDQLEAMEQPIASAGTAYGMQKDFAALISQAESRMYIDKEKDHVRFPEHKRTDA